MDLLLELHVPPHSQGRAIPFGKVSQADEVLPAQGVGVYVAGKLYFGFVGMAVGMLLVGVGSSG